MTLSVFTRKRVDFVIADSAERARDAWCEHVGGECPEDHDLNWDRLPYDEPIAIWCYDDGTISQIDASGAEPMELPAWQWVERHGAGFLASTEE